MLRSVGTRRTSYTRAISWWLIFSLLAMLSGFQLAMPLPVLAAQPEVALGTASSFGVLAGSAITNTGATTINGSAGGDVGESPGTSFVGQAGVTMSGAVHLGDAVAITAQNDLTTAYNDAAGRLPVTTVPTELGGTTLIPGVYDSANGTFQITGPLTLDAQGDPNAVFIFKTASTLITAVGSSVNFINGAQPCHVYWQVGSSATLGASSLFAGHLMALTSITANTGATIHGQLLARNGAVTLDTNTITNDLCAATTAAVSVSKNLAPGQSPTVRVGDSVSYVITVTNHGTTALTTVPLTDTFDSAHLTFVSSTPAPDATGAGTLSWNDLTGAGQLAAGQSIAVTVTFTASALGSATDTGTVAGAVDINSNTAPTAWGTASVAITNPHVSVAKVLASGQNGFVRVGDPVSYVITVTNNGDTTMTTVPLTDTFDSAHLTFVSASPAPDSTGVGTLTWNDLTGAGTLAPGQTVSVTVTFTASALGTAISNSASVNGATDINGDTAPGALATESSVAVTNSHVSVTKSLSPGQPSFVGVGDQVSYTIVVTNNGNTALVTVPLTDTFDSAHLAFVSASPAPDSTSAGTLTWNDLTGAGQLAPGQSITVTVTFTATALGTAISDTAAVAGATDINGSVAPSVSDTHSALAIVNAHLSVSKRLAPGQSSLVSVGGLVTYNIVVTNDGNTTLSSVPLTDAFDSAHLQFVSGSPSPDLAAAGLLTWNDITGAGTLSAGQSLTVSVTFRVTGAAGSVGDTATVAGAFDVNGAAAGASSATNAAVGTFAAGSIVVTKTAEPASKTIVVPGQAINYRVGYSNSSPTTMTAASIVDTISPAVTYIPGTLVLNGVPIPDLGNFNPVTHVINVALGAVAPGTSGVLTFSVTVGPYAKSRAGMVNVGSLRAGATTVATTSPVFHYVDSLDIVKSVTNTSASRVRTGSILLWTIVVSNRGIVPATNVVVTDGVPAHTTYVKGSIRGRGHNDTHAPALTWNVGTLGVGQSVTLTFKSSINDNVSNGTVISNRAFERSDQGPRKGSTARGGRVNDTTTIVVRTSGSEGLTFGLAFLLAALSLGFAWTGRPAKLTRIRGKKLVAVVLLGAAVTLGGMEVGAGFGLPIPSPGESLAAAVNYVSALTTSSVTAEVATTTGTVSGRVRIPSIGVNQKLVEGRSITALKKGLWHQPPSVGPGGTGACVIAGHRISSEFANLHKIRKGDAVYVTMGRTTYKYRVSSVSTRDASGATLGFKTGANEKLILYTCLPRWQGNKRTIVVCYRVTK